MAIGWHSINGYWLTFYKFLLMVIYGYFSGGYWCLLMVIVLLPIGGYHWVFY